MTPAPFVIERIVNAPVEKVWKAITDKDQMTHWYFDVPAFRAEVGAEFSFIGGTEKNTYVHLCQVKEVIPNKKLSYSWRYQGFEGDSLVVWELFDEGGKTRVKLTHEGLETFPSQINPDLAQENFVAGWTDIVGTLLKNFVEK